MAKKWTVHTETLLVRMPKVLKVKLEENAEKQGASQADIARVALEMYIQGYDDDQKAKEIV